MTAGSFNSSRAAQRNAKKAMKSGHIPALLAAFSVFVPASFRFVGTAKRRPVYDENGRRIAYPEATQVSAPRRTPLHGCISRLMFEAAAMRDAESQPERWGTRHHRRWRHKLQGA